MRITVVLEQALNNAAVLGLLVIIPMFLRSSPAGESEGCWPWQARAEKFKPGREERRAG